CLRERDLADHHRPGPRRLSVSADGPPICRRDRPTAAAATPPPGRPHRGRPLPRAPPAGRTVTVHSLASIEAGAGRALLEELNEEADRRGWTMTLDAANEALADYYAQFGYVTLADPGHMPSGERNVAMARTPRHAEAVSR